MEDVAVVLTSLTDLQRSLESLRLTHAQDLDHLFYGTGAGPVDPEANAKAPETAPEVRSGNSSVTPQQTKKRPKRLSSLIEDQDEPQVTDTTTNSTVRQSARISNSQLLAIAEDNLNSTATLMPPPPAPAPAPADTTLNSTRPQRAAKLKTEGLMKEPSLTRKLRRPSNEVMVKVKLENEQRPSQFNAATSTISTQEKEQPPKESEPAPELAMEHANADEENADQANNSRTLRVKIKREKISNEGLLPTPNITNSSVALEATVEDARPDETVASQEPGKKGRKKKKDAAASHRPIKVERFSELDTRSPVASRTRKGSTESRPKQDRSIYKDAMEELPIPEVPTSAAAQAICNETVTISNATMVLGPAPTEDSIRGPAADATFEVHTSGKKQPELPKQDSLLTEDESLEEKVPLAKLLTNVKAMKLPSRPHELFNPLLQSPVKMRVEAFENAASAANLRPKRVKEVQSTPVSGNTPKVGRLPAPAVGRFFTPTQMTSTLPASSAQPKKAPASASKATTLMKTATGTNLKSTNSSSTKTLSRENSGDDFRKGLHNLAEERKKQREQKHLQAALQREAKDRERAERMAKVAAERIKKQEERKRIEERKRQELEELQRKMRQQEEAEALKKAKLKEQEQQKLQQLTGAKPKKMLPPPPKTKYTWEMLHEDDSTDDEGKVTHKRPPAPTWSRSHVRGDAIIMQSHCPTDVIDSFFSVAPTTPDLKQIFPNIDPSQLKRNSSVLWSTPPRYSELPKY
ncbi:hypothetical protein KR026_012651 [Drosophila bipectinata]|nr:hypothetical protein KR026_012651 [Drosophila bipectinata]